MYFFEHAHFNYDKTWHVHFKTEQNIILGKFLLRHVIHSLKPLTIAMNNSIIVQ